MKMIIENGKLETKKKLEQGFSIIELLIVVLMISILSVLTLLSFKAERLFLADSQAYLILDVLKEAKQRAITQHETIRVEFNRNKNTVRLITENAAGDASDDQVIRTVTLENPNNVNISINPSNIAGSPVDASPVPLIDFKPSVYPTSASEQVATMRFIRNGNVLDAGTNAIGTNATMTGVTIPVWMPNYSDSGAPLASGSVIRAITVSGSTGNARFWRCPVIDNECTQWVP